MEHRILVGCLLVLLGGCNLDSTGDLNAKFDPGTGCSTRAVPPPDLVKIDTSATPRANPVAEVLALEASGEFIAPEALYQRVDAELTGLRAGFTDIPLAPCLNVGLIVGFTQSAGDAVRNGEYDAWNPLNEKLRGSVDRFLATGHALLVFDGVYNVNNLADAYGSLPGVESANGNSFAGDGSDTCLAIRNELHYYIVDSASGDCPAGCINHEYNGYEVDASGNIRHLGSYIRGEGQAPDWFEELEDCRAFL